MRLELNLAAALRAPQIRHDQDPTEASLRVCGNRDPEVERPRLMVGLHRCRLGRCSDDFTSDVKDVTRGEGCGENSGGRPGLVFLKTRRRRRLWTNGDEN